MDKESPGANGKLIVRLKRVNTDKVDSPVETKKLKPNDNGSKKSTQVEPMVVEQAENNSLIEKQLKQLKQLHELMMSYDLSLSSFDDSEEDDEIVQELDELFRTLQLTRMEIRRQHDMDPEENLIENNPKSLIYHDVRQCEVVNIDPYGNDGRCWW